VDADKKHARVFFEDLLRAVPVVDVPVEDRDLFPAVLRLRVARGDRDVVEYAEPHRAALSGMMARRANCAEHRIR